MASRAPDVGTPGSKAAFYDDLAYHAIRALIDEEHAVVWHEVEAKLSERDHPSTPVRINPHHLTNGRRRLLADNIIEPTTERSYGSRPITVLVPCNQRRRSDAIRTATRHKRGLEARYLGWAQTTDRHPNLIGEGGERVVPESLRNTVAGYGLVNPRRGEVETLFGERIPGGSLDNAANIALDAGDHMVALTVLIEVKNLRGWIYPQAVELFQLLHKAAALQTAHPRRLLLPVLVARRIHYVTYRMAKHLGVLMVEFDDHAQPILRHGTVKPQQLHEIREDLGYVLALTDEAMPGVTAWFDRTLPKEGVAKAMRWAEMAPNLAPHFGALRQESLSGLPRQEQMDRLYKDATVIAAPGPRGSWRRLDDT